MNKLTIDRLDIDGKKLLLRVDFNVPLDGGGVADDQRIVAALPTIRHALDRKASVILMSHLGRPAGRVRPEFSLEPVRDRLAEFLGAEVGFVSDCVGSQAERAASGLVPGKTLLLENLRFHPGEEHPEREPDFAEKLARLGDRYVNDAFGTAHRAHASMVAVAERFERPAAGLLLAKEIDYFSRVLTDPARPFVTILGGAKVSDKILLIRNLLERVDSLLIGGAMAYTFLRARGVAVGDSRVESERIPLATELLEDAGRRGVDILLPRDHHCATAFDAQAERMMTDDVAIPDGWMGLDIGPATIAAFSTRIREARTRVWNGPMGVFEWAPFADGTNAVARACVEGDGLSVVGGGDSAAAALRSGFADRFGHISTGGGASLELLEGKQLPGLIALADR